MTLTVYATTDELTEWLEGTCAVPANAGQLLRSATFVVARAINENPYADGLVVTDARRDATLAQVAAWLAAGVNPSAAGVDNAPAIKSKANDGASIDYDTSLASSVTAFQARQAIASGLAPEAAAILNSEGLLWAPVPLWSGNPDQGPYVDEVGHVSGMPGVSGVSYG